MSGVLTVTDTWGAMSVEKKFSLGQKKLRTSFLKYPAFQDGSLAPRSSMYKLKLTYQISIVRIQTTTFTVRFSSIFSKNAKYSNLLITKLPRKIEKIVWSNFVVSVNSVTT
jgi:hypothetical protein